MGNKIRRAKLSIFITVIAEFIVLGLFCVFYFLNFFDLQNLISNKYLVLGAALIIVINCISIWIISTRISDIKLRSDIKISELLSSEIEEVYLFGQIGMVVTDEENRVIWVSELFQNRHIDIIGQDIISWKSELGPLLVKINNEKIAKVFVNNRTYEVQVIQESNLWIFKDVTEYQTAYVYSRVNAVVFGVLNIDNYDSAANDDSISDTENRLKALIHSYFKEFDVVLRKTKEDSYYLICNYGSFAKMKDDHFSIIDAVRKLNTKDTSFSLSIGFAYDFPELPKLNDYAYDALDVALSRGGDQVVVFPYGRQIEFYGGKSASIEKTNRVKIRSLSDSVFTLIKNSSNVLIMGHTMMDMDAFGACLGMKAIVDRCAKEVKIVCDFKEVEGKTKSAIMSSFAKNEIQDIFVSNKEASSLVTPSTLLIVLDVHVPNMTMCPSLLDQVINVMVIDHHRRGKDCIQAPIFSHIDPSASSTCEIISEFIKYCSINPVIEIPAIYATFMLSGIFLDSTYFKSQSTSLRTFEAAAILKDYEADNALADDFLKDNIEEYREVNDFVDNFRMPVRGVAVCYPKEDRVYDPATIAKAANELLGFKGTRAAFAIAKTSNKEVKISARSDGSINVQLICEALGGGGSFERAAVSFEGMSTIDVYDKVSDTLKKNIGAATASDKKGN